MPNALALKTYELIYPYELDVRSYDSQTLYRNQIWNNFLHTVPTVRHIAGGTHQNIDAGLRQYSAVYFGSHIKFKHEEDMTLFLLRFS